MRSDDRDSGYVTLSALLVCAFLAAVAGGMLTAPRPTLARADLALEATKIEIMLKSGLELAAYRLFSGPEKPKVLAETRRLVGGRLTVSAAPEAGRVALNAAEPELIASLVDDLGLVSADAEAFAAAVEGLRSRDAEGEDADTPIVSLGALSGLAGLSADDLRRLAPHVTIYSQSAAVDVLSASPAVLAAIPGLAPGDKERLISLRERERGWPSAALEAIVADHAEHLTLGGEDMFRVSIDAWTERGVRARAEAVIAPAEATEGPPFVVLAWARAAPDQFGKGGR